MLTAPTIDQTLAGGRVKASLALAHLQWVRDCFGERVVGRVLAALLPGTAEEIVAAPANEWCSFETLMALDQAIAEICAVGRGGVYRELGRHAARVELASRGRAFAPSEIHRYLRCSAIRDACFLDRAVCVYLDTGPNSGRLMIAQTRTSSAVYCRGLAGYYEEVILTHGAETVEVTEPTCRSRGEAFCAFDFDWR
jgi:hypothetical protein